MIFVEFVVWVCLYLHMTFEVESTRKVSQIYQIGFQKPFFPLPFWASLLGSSCPQLFYTSFIAALTLTRQELVTTCLGSTTSTRGSFIATFRMQVMSKPYTFSHPGEYGMVELFLHGFTSWSAFITNKCGLFVLAAAEK